VSFLAKPRKNWKYSDQREEIMVNTKEFSIRANFFRASVLFLPLCVGFVLCFGATTARATDPEQKVVVPFDFVSKFDDGRYGEMVGDMLWKKLSKQGRFIIPEAMSDVRDYCSNHSLKPSPDMDLNKMKQIVRGDFDAHIGIWGSVERAPGEEKEIYDLVIKCVDFSAKPEPKVIYEVKARTNSVSEIPHLYVKQMLDALYERKPGSKPGLDPIAEENWKKNPNLVVGGDFERGSHGIPKGWDKLCGEPREPIGRQVQWLAEQGNSGNRVIRFNLSKDVAEFTGLMYYSEYFAVQEGATYRFQCRWRSNGPAVKVFVKCYDDERSEFREENRLGSAGAGKNLRKGDYVGSETMRREVYRSQQNLKGPTNTWNTQTEDFTPQHVKYSPKWCRVMLYAYITAGVVEFDDVVVKQIVPASSSVQNKTRRHSKETKITLQEMEENERRSKELKEKEKQEAAKNEDAAEEPKDEENK